MIVTLLGLDNFIMYILTINHTIVKRSSEIIRYIFILVDCMDLLSGTSEQRFLKFKLSWSVRRRVRTERQQNLDFQSFWF